jgi:hypothetical protein
MAGINMPTNTDPEKSIMVNNGDPDLESQTTHNGDKSEAPLPQSPEQDVAKETTDTVGWDGPDDPLNPQNWVRRKKLTTLAVIALMAFIT